MRRILKNYGKWITAAVILAVGYCTVFGTGLPFNALNFSAEQVDSVEILDTCGAVSEPVAKAMAEGARRVTGADVAVSVTGLAGPEGDEFGNPVGKVFIGYADERTAFAREYHFDGDRAGVREQTIEAALALVLEQNA